MTQRQQNGMSTFRVVWLGQLISLIGSGLTLFIMGIWVYQTTRSVTLFSMILLFGVLPGVILSPVAGALIDRHDRRQVMIISDMLAAFGTLGVLIALLAGRLELWYVYAAVGINSVAQAFQRPAYTTAIGLLVPREQLVRASGMVQSAVATAQIVAPLLAGWLLAFTRLEVALVIDLLTFLVAIAALAFVRFPSVPIATRSLSLGEEIYAGWRYIVERPGLLGLTILFVVVNFSIGIAQALLTPLILSFASAAVAGTVASLAAVGMLLGGIVLSAWGGPKQRVKGVLGFGVLLGLSLAIAGLRPSAPLITIALFGFFFSVPFIIGLSQVVWQLKTEPAFQGRVFATRMMIMSASAPVAFLIAGPLADNVFKPLLRENGRVAATLGSVFGVGPGRGIGLLLTLAGVLTIVAMAFGYLIPAIRRVEQALPDVFLPRAPQADPTATNLASGSNAVEAAGPTPVSV